MRKFLLGLIALSCLYAGPAEARRHHRRTPWCGIYMMQYTGIKKEGLALARNWARVGVNAGGPAVGVVVVWPHHVGMIVGRSASGQWLVHSGNDGNAIRTRARSVASAIAFRAIGGSRENNLFEQTAVAGGNENLVPLAVGGRTAKRLSKARALAILARSRPTLLTSVAAAHVTEVAYKPWPQNVETVDQLDAPLVSRKRVHRVRAHAVAGEIFSFGGSSTHRRAPHIRRAQGGDRPSSQAWPQSAPSTLLDGRWPDRFERAHASGGAAARRVYLRRAR